MLENAKLFSKVLVLNADEASRAAFKNFCEAHNLIPMKPQDGHVMAVLKQNVDLGGIFLSEAYQAEGADALSLARSIHEVRPELPIFLQRESRSDLNDLAEADRGMFASAYAKDDIEALSQAIAKSIFSLDYPNVLVRGISELTKETLLSQFKNVDVLAEAPYIVRDRIIYGELFTLITLESPWCRGYMMLQAEESPLIDFVEEGKAHIQRDPANFRDINHVLGEVTNMAWGAFKNRFISSDPVEWRQSQVPIIVNHQHRYISFGSEDPQLCFKYTLTDQQGKAAPLVVYQRFIFNLSWAPERFKENEVLAEDLVESGELEMF